MPMPTHINGKPVRTGAWTSQEDKLLSEWQAKLGNRWSAVAKKIPGRTGQQCAQRWRHKVNPNIRKEKWTDDEDRQLMRLFKTYGNAWAEISRCMNGRTDQQCMGRWRRHLDPSIKRDIWQEAEDRALMQQYELHGSSWSSIAKSIPGRTAQQCRARFFQLEADGVVERGPPTDRPQSRGRKSRLRQRRAHSSDLSDGEAEDGLEEDDEAYGDVEEDSEQETMVEGPDGMLRPKLKLRRNQSNARSAVPEVLDDMCAADDSGDDDVPSSQLSTPTSKFLARGARGRAPLGKEADASLWGTSHRSCHTAPMPPGGKPSLSTTMQRRESMHSVRSRWAAREWGESESNSPILIQDPARALDSPSPGGILIRGPPASEGEGAVLCNPPSIFRDEDLVWTTPGKSRNRHGRVPMQGPNFDSPLSCSTPPGSSRPANPDAQPPGTCARSLSRVFNSYVSPAGRHVKSPGPSIFSPQRQHPSQTRGGSQRITPHTPLSESHRGGSRLEMQPSPFNSPYNILSLLDTPQQSTHRGDPLKSPLGKWGQDTPDWAVGSRRSTEARTAPPLYISPGNLPGAGRPLNRGPVARRLIIDQALKKSSAEALSMRLEAAKDNLVEASPLKRMRRDAGPSGGLGVEGPSAFKCIGRSEPSSCSPPTLVPQPGSAPGPIATWTVRQSALVPPAPAEGSGAPSQDLLKPSGSGSQMHPQTSNPRLQEDPPAAPLPSPVAPAHQAPGASAGVCCQLSQYIQLPKVHTLHPMSPTPLNLPDSIGWQVKSLEMLNQRAVQCSGIGQYTSGPASPWKENDEPGSDAFGLPSSPPHQRLSTPRGSPAGCRDLFRQLSPLGARAVETLALVRDAKSISSPSNCARVPGLSRCSGNRPHLHAVQGA
eukprot:jgi/Botrbrau1/22267/Bobra.0138s0027.1